MADLVERLTELQHRILELRDFFDLPGKTDRLTSLESQQAEAGFWSNPETARASVQELKR